jgi:hypothetical protein
MARGLSFADVRTLAAGLDGIQEGTAYGAGCLRVKKTMIACTAINKAAEPNTLMIRLTFDQRDELIAEQPDVYYLKPHYEPYPCVLVRLSQVHREALRELLHTAWRLAGSKAPRPSGGAGRVRRTGLAQAQKPRPRRA